MKFTTVVAKMTTAFDMSAEEAGNAIAKISNVYGIKVDGMENVGNIINHLSDNTAAKAKEMVLTLNRIGGNAKQFGLEIDQASSLASAFISLGKQPEKAATAINNFLSKLQTAREQSPEFHDALDEMGTSIEELEQTIKKNPQEAILQFLETLKKIDDQERAGILMNLFGAGFQDDIALLVGSLYQTSLLGRQIEYTINSLKPPVIGGKHSFSFVSLLLRIGIRHLQESY
ncbi:phage tail tape measure protein [Wolbachia endosymbiont (group A) of Clivina fossor]|uniref:phage tail tape measure protein n=1 Tax=Wolbachia endosymbiont (group A) of Clivina fossor TaxID=3066133 RepID=UPI003132D0D2